MKRTIMSIYIDQEFSKKIEEKSKHIGLSKSALAIQLMEEGYKRFTGEMDGITRKDMKIILTLLEDIAKNSYGSVLASFKFHDADQQEKL